MEEAENEGLSPLSVTTKYVVEGGWSQTFDTLQEAVDCFVSKTRGKWNLKVVTVVHLDRREL